MKKGSTPVEWKRDLGETLQAQSTVTYLKCTFLKDFLAMKTLSGLWFRRDGGSSSKLAIYDTTTLVIKWTG